MRSVLVILDCGAVELGSTVIVRAYQFADLFRQNPRVRWTFVSRRSPNYVRLYRGLQARWSARPLGVVLARCEDRITRLREQAIVRQSRNFDLVYLLIRSSSRLQGKLLDEGSTKVVMDVNDALWLPDNHESNMQLEEMLQRSHAVICENDYIASYVRQYNTNVHIVPDSPQVEEFDKLRGRIKPQHDQVTLGWIGGADTADNLHSIFEPLEALFARHSNVHLRVLGATPKNLPRFEKVRFSCKGPYSNQEMIQEALQMDIGLFPLYRTEDSIARGTLKPRIYMSAGLAVVCQNWGEITKLIQNNINGILAESPEDWFETLNWLITHPEERKRIADQGLATIRNGFSRQSCFDRLLSAFEAV